MCTILLKKLYVHMPYYWNDLLQLLQVPLVSYTAILKDWSNMPLLADCKPHGTVCRME